MHRSGDHPCTRPRGVDLVTNCPLQILAALSLAVSAPACVPVVSEGIAAGPSQQAVVAEGPHFFYTEGIGFGRPGRTALLNAQDGSPRIQTDADYERFWAETAPLLTEWARDPRLRINPAYVAALLTKESGFEPFATSWVPANGYPQMTHIADADMLQIVTESSSWQWMLPEVASWPRHPLVHRADASKEVTDSLVAAGVITGANSYMFDPVTATRGAVFWLRILAEVWLEDEHPGRYGTFARTRLNDGAPLTEAQLIDLVTVSYNQGYTYVYALIEQHGRDWKSFVNEEAADHLERIRHYTVLYEEAG